MARFTVPRSSTTARHPVSAGKQPRNFSNRPQAMCQRRLPIPVTPTGSPSPQSPSALPPLPATPTQQSPSGSTVSLPNSRSTSPLSDITNSPVVNTSQQSTAAAISNDAVDIAGFIAEQREFNKHILSLATDRPARRGNKTPLPKTLTSNVRTTLKNIYGNELNDAWDLNKSFCCPENEEVNVKVTAAVQNVQKVSSSLIREALRVYYKTRKRQFKMSAQKKALHLKYQRVRSRLNTKRIQRIEALESSTSYTDEQKDKYRKILTNDFMSSEESGAEENDIPDSGSDSEGEDQGATKYMSVKKLSWRSQEVNDLFSKLDKRTARKRTMKGRTMLIQRIQSPIFSVRLAAENAPEWALQ